MLAFSFCIAMSGDLLYYLHLNIHAFSQKAPNRSYKDQYVFISIRNFEKKIENNFKATIFLVKL